MIEATTVAFAAGLTAPLRCGFRYLTVDTIGRRSEITYDSLIVAAGASQSYFGHPEFARDAPGMKTIDHALELRGRIFGAFEMAEREPDPAAQDRWLTFVVVGAGPTGVELAGQLAELSRRSLQRNFRHIDPAKARIILLDATPTVLGSFPESLRERAARELRQTGVEIHFGTMVTAVDMRGIETNSVDPKLRRIEAATKIWAAGVQASPLGHLLAEAAGAKVDRAGRVKVEPDCTLPGRPEVFVIGDLMSLDNLPGVAQVAIQSGRHAARTIARRLAGDTTRRPFRYRDLGTMATISRFRAIAVLGPLSMSGFFAWLLWLAVHLVALTGSRTASPSFSTGRLRSSVAAAPSASSQRSKCSHGRRLKHKRPRCRPNTQHGLRHLGLMPKIRILMADRPPSVMHVADRATVARLGQVQVGRIEQAVNF